MEYSMHFFWDTIIEPLLEAAGVRTVVEIGTEAGTLTKDLAAFCRKHGGTLHTIDPVKSTSPLSWEEEYQDSVVFHRDLSLNVLPTIDAYDAVIIDGDHNWYTVLSELQMIERQAETMKQFPIVILHDTGWPYARRDLYCDPRTIPEDARQPYRKQGVFPEEGLLADEGEGLNPDQYHAVYQGNARNGVLTAIEDFLNQTTIPLRFIQLPGMFGLGIIIDQKLLKKKGSLQSLVQEITPSEPLWKHMDSVESVRIHSVVEALHSERDRVKLRALEEKQGTEKHIMEQQEKEIRWFKDTAEHLSTQLKHAAEERDTILQTVKRTEEEKEEILRRTGKEKEEILKRTKEEKQEIFRRTGKEKEEISSTLHAEIAHMQSTRSWKMTAPLRKLEAFLRRRSAPPQPIAIPAVPEGNPPLTGCTIISKNYLSYARILAKSFREHHPDSRFFVLLVDEIDGTFDPAKEPFTLITLSDVTIPQIRSLCFQYSVTELNTAVKPFFLEYLLKKFSAQTLAFFDPDILITGDLMELRRMLERCTIVLTPHLTSPIDDDAKPGEQDMLRCGAFNLGFIGLRRSDETLRFLRWWQERLKDRCLHKVEEGYFVDQKWMDLAPGLFEGVRFLKHPGYNVAYWNLHERTLSRSNGKWMANGVPLQFFHFSGFDPKRSHEISRYQTRFSLRKRLDLQPIFAEYRERQIANRYNESSTWPYAFGQFANGVRIPLFARRHYLSLGTKALDYGDPFATESPGSFFAWLQTPIAKHSNGSQLTNLHELLWQSRPDIRAAFPQINGKDLQPFLQWIASPSQRTAYDLDPIFLQPHREGPKKRPSRKLTIAHLYHTHIGRVCGHTLKHMLPSRIFDRLAWKVRRRVGAVPSVSQQSAPHTVEDQEEKGMNIAGYLYSENGIGEAVRRTILAAKEAQIPVVLNNFDITPARTQDRTISSVVQEDNPYSVNLIHVNADQVPVFLETMGQQYLEGKYNIGYWFWELPNFPEQWQDRFAHFDEIWTASNYGADTLRSVSPIPVRVLPLPLSPCTPTHDREYFRIPKDTFVFLFVFDFLSIFERKNPLAVIEAFTKAFTPDEPVELIIKHIHGHAFPLLTHKLAEAAKQHSVRLIDQYYSRQEVSDLIACSDTYVSLHRAEGFGLTMAEAMALGKPVIATNYSGNTDFMTEKNSYPVRFTLTELQEDYGPYTKGNTWAEPNVEHAASIMRSVYENQHQARRIGKRAQIDVSHKLSTRRVGGMMRSYLEQRIQQD